MPYLTCEKSDVNCCAIGFRFFVIISNYFRNCAETHLRTGPMFCSGRRRSGDSFIPYKMAYIF